MKLKNCHLVYNPSSDEIALVAYSSDIPEEVVLRTNEAMTALIDWTKANGQGLGAKSLLKPKTRVFRRKINNATSGITYEFTLKVTPMRAVKSNAK